MVRQGRLKKSFEQPPPVGAAVGSLYDAFRMGHHAEHIACIIEDACDVARRSIHLFGIAESHAAFTLQPIKRCFVRDIVAIVMGYGRSEEHTSELQSLMRISYAVFCLNK